MRKPIIIDHMNLISQKEITKEGRKQLIKIVKAMGKHNIKITYL